MMKTTLFPQTDINSISYFPLFLLSDQLVVMQSWPKKPSETVESFINAGICQVEAPYPFSDSEEEKRFNHLIKNLAVQKENYSAQLESLTLASMSGAKESGEQSDRAISSAIKGEKKGPDQQAKSLWQARLILALGEILEREEEEIAAELAGLNDNTRTMIEELQGEAEDGDDALYTQLQEIQRIVGPARSGNIEKRVKAWRTIFAGVCGNILITTSMDAADQIITAYEAKEDAIAKICTRFTLPALIGSDVTSVIETIARFKAGSSELLTEFYSWLADLQNGASSDNKVVEKWELALEKTYPKAQYGRCEVDVIFFQGGFGEGFSSFSGKNGVMFVVQAQITL